MSISDQVWQARRKRVILAARKCFIRHGFHATGMAEIAKACRMSVGNLYHYFPNKHAIVQAITDETRARVLPVLRQLEDHVDPVEGIIEIIIFGVREFCRGSDARLWTEVSAEAARNRVIREICVHFDRDLRGVLKALLARAVGAGQISNDTDMEASSLWLVALLDGAIARVSLEPSLDITSTLDDLARNLRRCLCAPVS